MKWLEAIAVLLCLFPVSALCRSYKVPRQQKAAVEVIDRTLEGIGIERGNVKVEMLDPCDVRDTFSVIAEHGLLKVKGSSASAVCYGFYSYLRKFCHCMVTWSGEHCGAFSGWPDGCVSSSSPYEFRYFLNVCTFGYTMPYWGWERWEKEIDLMVLHGVNMPLASVATEAIEKRVWLHMGLSEKDIDGFFTGPAYLPWHRMGNIDGYDGPLDDDFLDGRIALQHKILDRMRGLGMHPVINAFAGFVPAAFVERHPEVKCTLLEWGGFDTVYNAYVLPPDSPYFKEIGSLFIREWEKEFGKNVYYLSDSFNEMKLPLEENDRKGKDAILKSYGEAVYGSISAGDPDAVWVTQGWTFGCQHDFWDTESLKSLLSGVPDDKLIIVDLANDYPKWIWHMKQTWKVHDGYYGKRWIFSYVPNFGGKGLPTGDMGMYASASCEALRDPESGRMVGFGAAPEGIENNEIVYELLADMGWSRTPVDLGNWFREYCLARYGVFDERFGEVWRLLSGSVYGSLYSYPRFTWQTVVPDKRRISSNALNDSFGKAVKLFLQCRDVASGSKLYVMDAVEYGCLWLGEVADRNYAAALDFKESGNDSLARKYLDKTISILEEVDGLLASYPSMGLSPWVEMARSWGRTAEGKDRYESDAKRLITVWGGLQEDYAARFWSGLIKDYYVPRLRIYFSSDSSAVGSFEQSWVESRWSDTSVPYGHPLDTVAEIVDGVDVKQ